MLEIFQYDFLIRAFIAGLITAIIAPLIGMFLVVRRYSLLADTLAHVSLVGVAAGLLSNTNPATSALITATIAALGIERLRQSKKIFGESILAIFLSGGLALAIVLVSLNHGLNVNILSYLFGSITTVTPSDLKLITVIGAAIVTAVTLFYKELFFISFNEELAAANGIAVKPLNMLLMVLSAISISIAIRIIGVLLIGALMIIPVVSAIQYKRGFFQTQIIAILISLISVTGGLFISYYANLPSGGTIVVTALAMFGLSLVTNQQRA